MSKRSSLLDEWARKLGCRFLSDLPALVGTEPFSACFYETPAGSHPLSNWRDAVEYLTGMHGLNIVNEAEARRLLIAHMMRVSKQRTAGYAPWPVSDKG